ncbi:MAG: TCR/Tet family MFS transporter [Pseudomonadota bacterium]
MTTSQSSASPGDQMAEGLQSGGTRKQAPGKNALAFIFITVMLNMIGFGVIIPVMPQLLQEITGQGVAEAARWGGILSATYALMQFIFSPIMGGLSDQFGRRPVILFSLLIYSLDFLLLALAPTVAILLLARMIAGAFAATFTTANAYIADISPPEKRAANFGLVGAAFGLGFIIGPAIGGYLGEQYGARAPFFFVAGLGMVNFIYGAIFLPETLAPENRRRFDIRRANAFGNFKQFAQYPIILPIALAMLIFQIGHWTFPSVWAYYAEAKFSWSPGEIAASLVMVGLAAAIVQGGLSRVIVPRFGERATAVAAIALAVIIYPLYGFINDGRLVYAVIPIGALVGLGMPALQGIMSRTIPANAQGELSGAVASISGLAMIVGPFLTTQIFSAFTDPGSPVSIGSWVVLERGAPFFFPGAPFVFSGILSAIALIPLISALNLVKRGRGEAVPDLDGAEVGSGK